MAIGNASHHFIDFRMATEDDLLREDVLFRMHSAEEEKARPITHEGISRRLCIYSYFLFTPLYLEIFGREEMNAEKTWMRKGR
ncbi:hypothetical protein VTL71DRAFT_1276 [Oculimacula yallundae]|uniref:Uncharacterized protein n=1 Tax=Oculimacula yallundae TaxID=86028 RepID=A0ABR4CB12_9HELO